MQEDWLVFEAVKSGEGKVSARLPQETRLAMIGGKGQEAGKRTEIRREDGERDPGREVSKPRVSTKTDHDAASAGQAATDLNTSPPPPQFGRRPIVPDQLATRRMPELPGGSRRIIDASSSPVNDEREPRRVQLEPPGLVRPLVRGASPIRRSPSQGPLPATIPPDKTAGVTSLRRDVLTPSEDLIPKRDDHHGRPSATPSAQSENGAKRDRLGPVEPSGRRGECREDDQKTTAKTHKIRPEALQPIPPRRNRSATSSSPPSAPLPPITLRLDPTLPGGGLEVEPALRTAVGKGEQARKRGFLRGLLGKKRKDEADDRSGEDASERYGEVERITPPKPVVTVGVEAELSESDAQSTERHDRVNAPQSTKSAVSVAEEAPHADPAAMAMNVTPPQEASSRSFLRPLRLLGSKTKSKESLRDEQDRSTQAKNESSFQSDASSDTSSFEIIDLDQQSRKGEDIAPRTITDPPPDHPRFQEEVQNPPDVASIRPVPGQVVEPAGEASELDRRLAQAQRLGQFQSRSELTIHQAKIAHRNAHSEALDFIVPKEAAEGDSDHQDEDAKRHRPRGELKEELSGRAANVSEVPSGDDKDKNASSDLDDGDSDGSESQDGVSTPSTPAVPDNDQPTSFLGKTFEGLPFGPDVPAVSKLRRSTNLD